MIDTYSAFLYGFEITPSNRRLDFNEGSGEITATIAPGKYTAAQLIAEVQAALNDAGNFTYTVTFNRTTRKITIASSSAVTFLCSTGTNVALGLSAYSALGFNATNRTSVTSALADNAIGSVYLPQYKLQDFVSHEDSRAQRFDTRTVTASGKVQIQTFGVDRFFEFSIKYATNIKQPASGPILNNSSGVNNLRSFMQWLITGAAVDFIPDSAAVSTYHPIVLESNQGTEYKLTEQFSRGLVGYWETPVLKFRILEP